jgi:hypothetical protein
MPDQESATTRQCPFCKEEVKVDALRCKHCQATIPPEKPTHRGVCPFCKENINPEAIRCMHCKANLAPPELHACGQERSPRGFSPPYQMTAPAALRLRRVSGLLRARECPPAMMDGSTMWCLVDFDGEYCTYEVCGYV